MVVFSLECLWNALIRSCIWQLMVRLQFVRREYEDLKLRNSELQRKLDAFTRDRRRILETLDLVTDENKKAIETVKFLKNKVSI